jgi:Spy/CpxP family protein refolding chaperone
MIGMKRALLALALCVGTALPALSQNRANFAWWNSEVVGDLNLSDAQRRQIREVVSAYRPKMIDARGDVQKALGDLQDVLNGDHIDVTQATPIVNRLAEAQAESTRVFTEMSLRMRAVLTLEQWRELVKRWGTLQKGQRPNDTQVQP